MDLCCSICCRSTVKAEHVHAAPLAEMYQGHEEKEMAPVSHVAGLIPLFFFMSLLSFIPRAMPVKIHIVTDRHTDRHLAFVKQSAIKGRLHARHGWRAEGTVLHDVTHSQVASKLHAAEADQANAESCMHICSGAAIRPLMNSQLLKLSLEWTALTKRNNSGLCAGQHAHNASSDNSTGQARKSKTANILQSSI